jgi:hypothetical protein
MISIDYVAGSHGYFLEYVCNKHICNMQVNFLPFNSVGASHLKTNEYINNRIFHGQHFTNKGLETSKRVVRITYDHNDLLLLMTGAFLRIANSNIETNELENDTYNKLMDSAYFPYLVDSINDAYPRNRISAENPNCPRYVLREFFKFGFKHPESNGFIKVLEELVYDSSVDSIDFPYRNFYNKQLFIEGIQQIADWYDQSVVYNCVDDIWEKFYERQIYRNYKSQADNIIHSIQNLEIVPITELGLFQESYIDAVLENKYGIEMPFGQNQYFDSTAEIINHLCLK